jgi:hypothetical protein
VDGGHSMKYYIANIVDCLGEREFSMGILTTSDDDHIEDKINDIAKNWYGDDSLESEEGVFQNGDIITYCSDYKEITEATFKELKYFIGEL